MWRQTYSFRRKMLMRSRRKRLEYCSCKPRKARMTRNHQKPGRGEKRTSLGASKRSHLCWLHDFGLPASKTVRNIHFCCFQFSLSVLSDSLWPHKSQNSRPPCPSLSPGVHSNSCPSSRWCHPAISSSVVPFPSCLQSLPASESFPMSRLFTWGGQSTGVSALASFLPKNTQGSSPSEWTGWISLQSKGLSGVFFNTVVQKHQFFGAQLSL